MDNYGAVEFTAIMKDLIVTVVVSLCLTTTLVIENTLANPDAKRLYDDLLSNYNRLIRPVSNHTEKVTVKLGLRLSQLVDLVSTGSPNSNWCFFEMNIE